MTLPTQSPDQYPTNGTQTVFSYTFKINQGEDLAVYLLNTATNIETELVLDSDYTVTGVGNNGGGTIVTTSTYASGYRITIRRDIENVQDTSFGSNMNAIPSQAFEAGLDDVVMMVQKLEEQVNRALKGNPSTLLNYNSNVITYGDAVGKALLVGADGFEVGQIVAEGAISYPVTIAQGGTGSTSAAGARANLGIPTIYNPNFIYNGNFELWNNGVSFSTTGETADQWYLTVGSGATVSVARQAFTVGQTDVPQGPIYFTRFNRTVTGSASSTYQYRLNQGTGKVRALAGQTCVLTFYAKGSTAFALRARINQNFGTGGTPSAQVNTAQQVFTLASGWQKFTLTFTLPSISGKTFGSNGNDYLGVEIIMQTGVGAVNFDIAQVKLEIGNVATNELLYADQYSLFIKKLLLSSSASLALLNLGIYSTIPYRNITVYDTAGTFNFTVPANVTELYIELCGGGSGGGAAYYTTTKFGGPGGPAGGYARKKITGLVPGAVISVVIGAGGIGGQTEAAASTAGGTTSFGAYVSATGGSVVGFSINGLPGIGVNGDLNLRGGALNVGIPAVAPSTVGVGAPGGLSYFGGSGTPGDFGVTPGGSGRNGSGGAGGEPDAGNNSFRGGNGGPGMCIIYY